LAENVPAVAYTLFSDIYLFTSQLFVSYAHAYRLPECKLSLMRAANLLAVRPSAHQMESRVTLAKVWEDIVQDVRSHCERHLGPGENSLRPVMDEVLRVARRYLPQHGDAGPFVPLGRYPAASPCQVAFTVPLTRAAELLSHLSCHALMYITSYLQMGGRVQSQVQVPSGLNTSVTPPTHLPGVCATRLC